METLMDADMAKGKPVIFIDPKGDTQSMHRFIQLCRHHHRPFAAFSEHYSGENKIHLNPVGEGSPTQIADRIHYSFNWSEEHYETLCYQALKKACTCLQRVTPPSLTGHQAKIAPSVQPHQKRENL